MPDAFRHVTESIAAEAASYSGAETRQATSKPAPPFALLVGEAFMPDALPPGNEKHRG
jgi:hypothetical protein